MRILNNLMLALCFCLAIFVGTAAQAADDEAMHGQSEQDRAAPIDWGYGPGVKPAQATKSPTGSKAKSNTSTATVSTQQGGK